MVNPTLAIHSLIKCTPTNTTEKLWLTCMGNTDVVSMLDNGVTNLCGKTLLKLIHRFHVMVIKVLPFSINMLYFLKIQSIHVPKIFIMKSNLLNMFNLIKLYAIC